MAFVNLYKPPVLRVKDYINGTEPYDLNFCFPVPDELSSDRVMLVPFTPSLHSTQYLATVSDHPELYHYLGYGPFKASDPSPFNAWLAAMESDPGTLLFAIIDKTHPSPSSHPDQGGALAGVITYLNADAKQLRAEIGHILIFPAWHRTFLTTNAVCLLINHAFQVPSPPHSNNDYYSDGTLNVTGSAGRGGWGLRRVFWQTHQGNTASMNAALRMGMRLEGIARWDRVLPPARVGHSVIERAGGDPMADRPGRHSVVLALCWNEYERETYDNMILRQ